MVDTVEITNLSDADKVELERRAALDKVSPKEAIIAGLTIALNNDNVITFDPRLTEALFCVRI